MSLLLSSHFTGLDKHTSLLSFRIDYIRNLFYDTGPRSLPIVCGTVRCATLVGYAALVINIRFANKSKLEQTSSTFQSGTF